MTTQSPTPKLHHWEAWEGEAIAQCYTDEDSGETTIVLENGRAVAFGGVKRWFVTNPDKV